MIFFLFNIPSHHQSSLSGSSWVVSYVLPGWLSRMKNNIIDGSHNEWYCLSNAELTQLSLNSLRLYRSKYLSNLKYWCLWNPLRLSPFKVSFHNMKYWWLPLQRQQITQSGGTSAWTRPGRLLLHSDGSRRRRGGAACQTTRYVFIKKIKRSTGWFSLSFHITMHVKSVWVKLSR